MRQSSRNKRLDAPPDGNDPPVSGALSVSSHVGDDHPVSDRSLAENMQRIVRESELLRRIAVKANEAVTTDEAIQMCLDEVCDHTGWPVGHAYMIATNGTGELDTAKLWHMEGPERYEIFRRVTEETRYTSDLGLPTRVMAEATPQWMVSDMTYQHLPRANARIEAGLKSGFAFPAMAGKSVVAVLEFFSPEVIEPDQQFLSVTAEIGILIGQVIERKLAEQVLKNREQEILESRDQLRLITDNLPALIVYVDAEQRYQFANKTACEWHARPVEELIGRTASEIHGQEYEKIRSRVENTLAGEQLTYIETITHSDGVTRATRATSVPHRGPAGKVIGFFSLVEDITEIKQAEEAARESEARLRAIADHSPSAIFLKGTEGRFITANQVWHDTYNPTGEDITGKTVHDFVPSDVAAGAVAIDAKILATGEPVVEEQYLPSADGETQYVLSTKFPVRDNDGNIIAIGGVNIDITERVRAERQVRESEERFRALIDNLPNGISLKDTEGRFVHLNDKAAEIFRLPENEILSRTSAEMLTREKLADFEVADRDIIAGRRDGFSDTLNVTQSDGQEHIYNLIKFPVFDADTRPAGVGTISTDITESKRAERALVESRDQLRLVTDNLPVWITYIDAEQRYRFVNKTAAEWLARPAEEIVGRTVSELMGQEYEKFRSLIDKVLAGEQQAYIDSVKTPDGATRTIQATYVPHRGADGNVEGYFALAVDISELQQTEELLRQAQKMEVVGQLTGGVAHDFNNLLAVVIGNLEMVAENLPVDTPVSDYVRSAFTAAEQGASLTHQLLAFSRQQVLQPEETDLGQLIAETKMLMSVSMGEKITVKLETDDDLWRCKVDQVQLQNAILNMSINARDAMKARGELTIRAENVRLDDDHAEALELDEGDYVCLSVSDTGTGIPEDVIEHIYEPFYTTKDVGEGSGLGLSMVYGFAQQSGGGVDIETEVGEGTTINLYFPAIVSAAVTAIEEAAQPQDNLTAPDATILLVEDNAAFREVTRTILESLNFRVIDFGSAEEALSVIGDTTPFDLLLSDIGLPGDMNGHDLVEYATSARPGLKTVLMSAHADLKLNGGIIDTNVAAFLRKPHRKTELAQTLRRVLGLDILAT